MVLECVEGGHGKPDRGVLILLSDRARVRRRAEARKARESSLVDAMNNCAEALAT